MGRGVAAATIMGQIRAATRGAALSDPRPESVLSSLDDLVVGLDDLWPASVTVWPTPDHIERGFRGELFVTMLYGLLDTTTGELMLASAGHCPPAVVPSRGPDGASPEPGQATGPRLVDLETGPPLGMRGARPVHTLTLGFGELLLAFTDGLLERRTGTLADGEQRLLEMLQELRCDSPLRACKLVLEAMGADGSFEDDCALLAVRRSPVAHHSESLFVPPLPEAVRPAREWARVLMRAWGIEEGEQFGVVTGLSELVTNAVLHAGTECQVTLELEGSRLTVTVTDTGTRGGPWSARRPWSARADAGWGWCSRSATASARTPAPGAPLCGSSWTYTSRTLWGPAADAVATHPSGVGLQLPLLHQIRLDGQPGLLEVLEPPQAPLVFGREADDIVAADPGDLPALAVGDQEHAGPPGLHAQVRVASDGPGRGAVPSGRVLRRLVPSRVARRRGALAPTRPAPQDTLSEPQHDVSPVLAAC